MKPFIIISSHNMERDVFKSSLKMLITDHLDPKFTYIDYHVTYSSQASLHVAI